jgi:hypothetical protein
MAVQVTSADTYYQVYGQNTGRVSRENFVEVRPGVPRLRKGFRNDRAKEQAWEYALDLVERTEREGAESGLAYVRIRYHEPGKESAELWRAAPGDERWARMVATRTKRP